MEQVHKHLCHERTVVMTIWGVAFSFGILQSLEMQFDLYSEIRSCLTMYSKPNLRYLTHAVQGTKAYRGLCATQNDWVKLSSAATKKGEENILLFTKLKTKYFQHT